MPNISVKHPTYLEAQGIRSRLTAQFAHLDTLNKRIKKIPSLSIYSQIVLKNITQSNILFLQQYMFSLQFIPKPMRKGAFQESKISPQVMVLMDQKSQLDGMIQDALKKRKLEDVEALRVAMLEVRCELENAELNQNINS